MSFGEDRIENLVDYRGYIDSKDCPVDAVKDRLHALTKSEGFEVVPNSYNFSNSVRTFTLYSLEHKVYLIYTGTPVNRQRHENVRIAMPLQRASTDIGREWFECVKRILGEKFSDLTKT